MAEKKTVLNPAAAVADGLARVKIKVDTFVRADRVKEGQVLDIPEGDANHLASIGKAEILARALPAA